MAYDGALEDAQQEAFVRNLLKGMGKGEAYLAAGYKCKSIAVASACANRTLKKANVAARYEQLQGKKIQEARLEQADIAQMLIEDRIAARQANQFSAAISAVNALMKLYGHGMETRKIVGDPDNPLVIVSKDQRDAAVRAALRADA